MKRNRRQFLGTALGGASSLAFPGFLPARDDKEELPPGGSAKRVIYLLMRGGMSQFETFDLKQAAHHPGGPNQIPSAIAGYSMSEWLPELAKRMNHCAVIRSMSTIISGHHDDGEYTLRTGYQRRRTLRHPSVGAWTSWHFAKQKKPHVHFQIGGDAETAEEWMGPKHAPMLIRHPARASSEPGFRLSAPELEHREQIWMALNKKHGSQKATGEFKTGFRLMREGIEDIVDVKQAPLADQIRYGPHPFGEGCLIARRLAEADASCFTEVILEGWNPTAPYFPQVRANCAVLDKALSALLDDLDKLGLLEETLVVLATPCGREPTLRNGTRMERSMAFSCLLAGGGIRGGQLHGETDSTGRKPKAPVKPHELTKTIAWALGIDYDITAYSPSGRPFTMGTNQDGLPLIYLFEGHEKKER